MESLKPLVALLAIVNPIGVVPFFIHFTQSLSREQRRRTIHISSFNMSDGAEKIDAGASIAVLPLAIPLLTGPATVSTMVIYAEKTRFLWQLGVLVGYGVVIGLVTCVVFSASGRIAKVLGRTGINVMTRLMGLMLAAMAVELLADGLVKLFPVLASHMSR